MGSSRWCFDQSILAMNTGLAEESQQIVLDQPAPLGASAPRLEEQSDL